MSTSYLAVFVHVHVLPDAVDAFREASLANAAASIREPGVVRFDLVQETVDPTRFVLIEVYRNADGAAAHKQTSHYQAWRDTVAAMMAEPRAAKSYATVSPFATWALDGKCLV
jgi:(4S)-4-hydroxy-5-phosphonooxypentane-2,3-dione isomerase